VLIIIFKIIRKDKNAINIYNTKDIKKKAKHFVNLGLKSNRGVKKAKRYYKGFKKAITGVKYSYLFLVFFILNLVKCVNNIKLNIKLSCIKLKKRFLKKRKRVAVLDCDYIKCLVINAKS
jgi:hypothetical protein